MIKTILLQCKFFLVEFLNVTYPLIPNPLRNFYLRMYGIRVEGTEKGTCFWKNK